MRVHGKVVEDRIAELEAYVAGHTTTERLVRAALEDGHDLAAFVEMDEFTIDVVVRLGDGLCLVYDTT